MASNAVPGLDRIWVWVSLGIVLCLASFLRFWEIGTNFHFMGDEGAQAEAEWRLIHGHLPLLGPSLSIGGHLGPFFYYLAAIPLWLTGGSPVGPTVMVGVIGVATVLLLFLYLRAPLGDWPALGAAAVMACSFLMVEYSRRPWNPTPTPFFTLLLLWSLVLWKRHSARYVVLTAGCLAILIQLQPVNVFVVALAVIFVVLARPPLPTVVWIAGAAGVFLAVCSPLIIYDAAHGMSNTGDWLHAVFGGKHGAGGPHFSSPRVLFNLFNRAFEPRIIAVSIVIAVALCVAGIWVWLVDNDAMGTNWEVLLGLILLAIAAIGFEVYRKEVFEQYLVCLFPVPFIFLAALLRMLWKGRLRKLLAGVVVVGLGAVGIRDVVQYSYLTPTVTIASAGASTHDLQPDDTYGHVLAVSNQIGRWVNSRRFAFEMASPINYSDGYAYVLERRGYVPNGKSPRVLVVEPPTFPERDWKPRSLVSIKRRAARSRTMGIVRIYEVP